MAKLSLKFNEDHIKLIKCLRFERQTDNLYGIDNYALFGGTFLYEQMAMILGVSDQVLPESLESPLGPRYPEETMKRLMELDEFIVEHLNDIEDILHQHCTEGIQADQLYTCWDYARIWVKGDIRQIERETKKKNKTKIEE